MYNQLQQIGIQLPVAVIGLGISGKSAKRLLHAAGIATDEILVFDENEPSEFLNLGDFFCKTKPKVACVSPGVPIQRPEIQEFLNSGGRLTSELEIATSFLTDEILIAVTGSIGKSTVTSLLGEAGRTQDTNIFVGGNLGTPLADYVFDLLQENRKKAKYIVLELSSYQLENYKNLRAECGVITYLGENHLERYSNLEEYYNTKFKIIPQSKNLVLNLNGGDLKKHYMRQYSGREAHFVDRNSAEFIKKISSPPALLGNHNLDNLSLVFKVASILGWTTPAYLAALQFKGLPHRLESCGEKNGILFINDSKATTMNSVIEAFKSIREQFPGRKIHLLLGGKDKNLPWNKLNVSGFDSNVTFYFFGEVANHAKQVSNLSGKLFLNLKICLENIKASPGDIVLLSPGGTSHDEFKNFEERGDFFKKWVKSIEEGN